MKNVLIIARALSYGGAEKTAVNLANQLSELKTYYVTLCVLDGRNRTYKVEESVNLIDLKLDILNKGNKAIFYKKLLSKVAQIKKKNQINISISFLSEPDLANILTKRKNEKIIVSVRNKQSKISVNKFKRIRDKIIFNRADTIVSLSEMVKNDLISIFGVRKSKISVIYNFGNNKQIEDLSQKKIDVEDTELFDSNNIIISVGRLVEQKGQWHLIKSFKKVKKVVPDTKLIILGQGPLSDDLADLVKKLGLEKEVFLLGFKENPFPYIRRSSLFVFPSLFEGLGNVLVETLSCETPIISADCDAGPREILSPETDAKLTGTAQNTVYGDYGILVPAMKDFSTSFNTEPDNSENYLSDAIIEFLLNTEIQRKYKLRTKNRAEAYEDSKILKEWVSVLEQNDQISY